MKKQLTALTCALALGLAAVCSSAAGQGAEATSKIGYALAHGASGGVQAVSAGALGAAGSHMGQRAAFAAMNPPTVIQAGVRTAFVARNVLMGARIGAAFGVWGGLPALVIGAAIGAA